MLGAIALKWAFVFGKFFAFFVSFALYSALFHSWEFGLGLVLLILVHEMGHYAEAKRAAHPRDAADVRPVLRRIRA